MKVTNLKFNRDWRVIRGTKRCQAAVMVVAPGDAEGSPTNKHSGDQWLFVEAGQGVARVNGKRILLRPRTLLLIEAGEKHEIRNTGRAPLKTLNFYSPPQY